MSLLSAWKTYQNLDARQRAFMREKRIEASMPLEKWIAFLAGVARYDRVGDRLRKLVGWSAGLSIPVAIVLAIMFNSSLALLLWIVTVMLGLSWWQQRKIDVPPVLDRFLLPWLVLLKEDVAKDSEVALSLDFQGAERAEKLVPERDMPKGFKKMRDCKEAHFRDPWLSGTASLADGSVLQWDICDFVRTRTKTRSNARGKTKRKIKYKVQRSFDVQLKPRTKDYQLASPSSNAAFRSSVKSGEKRLAVRVRNRTVLQESAALPQLSELVETVSRAYSHLYATVSGKEHS